MSGKGAERAAWWPGAIRGGRWAGTARERWIAVGQAVLATALWSSSWLLIKVGMSDHALAPLGFAGLRYSLAALVLIPLAAAAWRPSEAKATGGGDRAGGQHEGARRWLGGAVLVGVLLYGITYGLQFVALGRLPAATVSLVMTFTTVVVAAIGWLGLAERPSIGQAAAIGVVCVGATLYFAGVPTRLGGGAAAAPPAVDTLGLALALVATAMNGVSIVLTRALMRSPGGARRRGAVAFTAVGMAVGGPTLLTAALALEGTPRVAPGAWALVVWLALAHTALPFALWNAALGALTAAESSALMNSLLVQIALLAWVFLGEGLGAAQMAGLALVTAGVLAVQLAPRRPPRAMSS